MWTKIVFQFIDDTTSSFCSYTELILWKKAEDYNIQTYERTKNPISFKQTAKENL